MIQQIGAAQIFDRFGLGEHLGVILNASKIGKSSLAINAFRRPPYEDFPSKADRIFSLETTNHRVRIALRIGQFFHLTVLAASAASAQSDPASIM